MRLTTLFVAVLVSLLGALGCGDLSETGGGANRPPSVEAVQTFRGTEGQALALRVRAFDPDGDSLRFFPERLPPGAQLDVATGSLEWTPGYDQAGRWMVPLQINDTHPRPLAVRAQLLIDIEDVNRPPEVAPLGSHQAWMGQLFSLSVLASDPDQDRLRYVGSVLPPGATVDADSGLLSWTPQGASTGSYELVIHVLDGHLGGELVSAQGSVHLDHANQAPRITPPPALQGSEGEPLWLQIQARDPEGHGLRYAGLNLPSGAVIQATEGRMDWTPDFGQMGRHEIQLVVEDDGSPPMSAMVPLTITVEASNSPPEAHFVPDLVECAEGASCSAQLQTADREGDGLRMVAVQLPVGAWMDPHQGHVEWTPGWAAAGDHVVSVRVHDDGSPARQTLASAIFRVSDVNRPPSLDIPPIQQVTVGSQVELFLRATDPDGDSVRLEALALPEGAQLDGDSGAFRWIPGEGQEGEVRIEIVAEDDGSPPARSEGVLRLEVLPGEDVGPSPCPAVCEVLAGCGCAFLIGPQCRPACGTLLPDCVLRAGELGLCEARGCFEIMRLCEGRAEQPMSCRVLGDEEPAGGGAVDDPQHGEEREGELAETSTLAELLAGEPEVLGGQNAPQLSIYPATPAARFPIRFRVCVVDADGVGNLNPEHLAFEVNGTSLTDRLGWVRAGPDRVCGLLDPLCDFGIAPMASHQVFAWISDRDGEEADAEMIYEAPFTAAVRFVDATPAAGFLDFRPGGNGYTGGASFADADGDGDPDLFLGAGSGEANRLYRNLGRGRFEAMEVESLSLVDSTTAGGLYADIDNDGDLDLFVYTDHAEVALGPDLPSPIPGDGSHLFRNDGDGGWTDITQGAGLAAEGAGPGAPRTIAAAFADYDRDGCVDLYTVHWRMGAATDLSWDGDRLYRGDCEGGFLDVTEQAGLGGVARKGAAVLFSDLDGDDYPDLYVANVESDQAVLQELDPAFHYGGAASVDSLFLNNGDGSFREAAQDAGVGWDAVGARALAAGDFDADGDLDLYITDRPELPAFGNVFYRNMLAEEGAADGLRFVDEAFIRGSRPLSAASGWGTNGGDFNNDGHLDLLALGPDGAWLYLGTGGGDFVIGSSPGESQGDGEGWADSSGLPADGRGTAVADYDDDGDLDLVVWRALGPVLLENVSDNDHHWLQLELVPANGSATAIGARVRAHWGAPDQRREAYRWVLGGSSRQSQSDSRVHLGLGAEVGELQVEIVWPSGQLQQLEVVEADQLLRVEEP